MVRWSVLGLLVGLAGCGSTIGAFDGLPPASDVGDAPWPRLVDTPEAPEDRLIAGNGAVVEERLSVRRGSSEARQARADSVAPVSDSLLARGVASQSRPANVVPPVDEAALLERAARLQERTQRAPVDIDDSDLLARAARAEERTRVAPSEVNEVDLLGRAEVLRQRAADVNAVNETELLARAGRSQQNANGAAVPVVSQSPVAPRAPVPLRPLDTPVVSSSFEERARLARERAAGL